MRWLSVGLLVGAFLCGISTLVSAAEPGDIIITEIMQNPAAVPDDKGEWFEIYNTTGSAININGWIIKDNDTDSHTIDNGGSLSVSAYGFLVLGRNGDSGQNGGYTCDYEYSGFLLANGDDEVILMEGATEICLVSWARRCV